jgi:hypothetical protein
MTEPIQTVAALRTALADVPDDIETGPYMIEYSPSDRRLDVHPVDDEPIPYLPVGLGAFRDEIAARWTERERGQE